MRRSITAALFGLLALSACGTEQPASATQRGTAAPVETTEAPTTTEAASPMHDIRSQCLDYVESTLDSSRREAYDSFLAATLVTDGESISVDGAWAEEGASPTQAGLRGDLLICVLDETDAPQRVTEHIESTRALDGQQTDEWEEYSARWSFHPDDGMSLTVWSES